jgi:hypothetical protein
VNKPHSQNCILISTYKWPFLGPFISLKEVNCCEYSQNFIIIIINELAQKTRVLPYTRLEMLARDKHSSVLGPIIVTKKMKCCEYAPGVFTVFSALHFNFNLQKAQ